LCISLFKQAGRILASALVTAAYFSPSSTGANAQTTDWKPVWEKLIGQDFNGKWQNRQMGQFVFWMGFTIMKIEEDGSVTGKYRRQTPDGYHCSVGNRNDPTPKDATFVGTIAGDGSKFTLEVAGDELEKLNGGKSSCSPTQFQLVVKGRDAEGVPNNFVGEGKSHFILDVLGLARGKKWQDEPAVQRYR
jgi:hypothetical protein